MKSNKALSKEVKILTTALRLAAEEAYKSEILDTEMEFSVIGENGSHSTKEEWIEDRIAEWRDSRHAIRVR